MYFLAACKCDSSQGAFVTSRRVLLEPVLYPATSISSPLSVCSQLQLLERMVPLADFEALRSEHEKLLHVLAQLRKAGGQTAQSASVRVGGGYERLAEYLQKMTDEVPNALDSFDKWSKKQTDETWTRQQQIKHSLDSLASGAAGSHAADRPVDLPGRDPHAYETSNAASSPLAAHLVMRHAAPSMRGLLSARGGQHDRQSSGLEPLGECRTRLPEWSTTPSVIVANTAGEWGRDYGSGPH